MCVSVVSKNNSNQILTSIKKHLFYNEYNTLWHIQRMLLHTFVIECFTFACETYTYSIMAIIFDHKYLNNLVIVHFTFFNNNNNTITTSTTTTKMLFKSTKTKRILNMFGWDPCEYMLIHRCTCFGWIHLKVFRTQLIRANLI